MSKELAQDLEGTLAAFRGRLSSDGCSCFDYFTLGREVLYLVNDTSLAGNNTFFQDFCDLSLEAFNRGIEACPSDEVYNLALAIDYRANLFAVIGRVKYEAGNAGESDEAYNNAIVGFTESINSFKVLLNELSPDAYGVSIVKKALFDSLNARSRAYSSSLSFYTEPGEVERIYGLAKNDLEESLSRYSDQNDRDAIVNLLGSTALDFGMGVACQKYDIGKSINYLQNSLEESKALLEDESFGLAIVIDIGKCYEILFSLYSKSENYDMAQVIVRESLEFFSRVIERGLVSASIYYRRSKFFTRNGDPKKAAMDLMQAVDLAPENIKYRLAFARQLELIGHYNHSLQQYNEIICLAPRNSQVLEEAATVNAKNERLKEDKKKYFEDVKRIGAEYSNMPENYSLRNLSETPNEDDFFYLLRDELESEISYQMAIATGKSPAPETYVHKMADIINLVGPNLVSSGFLGAIATEVVVQVATKIATAPIDRWNQLKSQNIVSVLHGMNIDGEEGFVDIICEDLTVEYGPIIESLKLNSIGLIGLVATIVERMFVEMGNNQELVDMVKRGEINPIEAFKHCVKVGTADYPSMSRDMVFYDSSAIISGFREE